MKNLHVRQAELAIQSMGKRSLCCIIY